MNKLLFVLLSVVTPFASFSYGRDNEVNPSKEPSKETIYKLLGTIATV